MLFHSFGFFIFFWIVFAVYWAVRAHRLRMMWLLGASMVFYAVWNVWFMALIVFTAGVDYMLALKIESASGVRARRAWLALSLVLSLTPLCFFKYAGFLSGTANGLLGILGVHLAFPAWKYALPLGISFYTFETISYVVDVYRGRVRAERNALNYALYIMFFPHLIAGPIVRPGMFLAQIGRIKRFDWQRLQLGVQLFLRGLLKKAVLADRLATVADPVFAAPDGFASGTAWIATVAYALQIYCDFSGYTDMALGAAHAFGFKLPQNFNRPYFSDSVGEFWRRWHMSLSQWLRDYLYIPLGGSRGGLWRTCRNFVLTMGIAGLWHGAGWNFVLFGLCHGVALSVERIFTAPVWLRSGLARPFRIAATFLFWSLSLVFFRSTTLAGAGKMFARLFQPGAGSALPEATLLMAGTIFALVFLGHLAAGRNGWWSRLESRIPAPVLGIGLACLFLLIQLLIPEDASSFIYFQF